MIPALPIALVLAVAAGGEVVTLSDLEERAGAEWARVQQMDPGPARDAARRAALQRALDTIVASAKEELLAELPVLQRLIAPIGPLPA